jgi:hypothetical protein
VLRHRLLIATESILVGWALLFPLTYVMEPLLLIWTTRLLGTHWLATAKSSLECLALAVTGWVIGRLHRSTPLIGVLAFAVTVGFCNLDPRLDINLLWLIRLAADALRDSRYVDPFVTTIVQYIFLFASLIGGGLLSRPAPTPLSIFGENSR